MYYIIACVSSWCGAGSNRRHKDFQSFALPTELPHRLELRISNKEIRISKWVAKIRDSFKRTMLPAYKYDTRLFDPIG